MGKISLSFPIISFFTAPQLCFGVKVSLSVGARLRFLVMMSAVVLLLPVFLGPWSF